MRSHYESGDRFFGGWKVRRDRLFWWFWEGMRSRFGILRF
jgi:hypothetical protein